MALIDIGKYSGAVGEVVWKFPQKTCGLARNWS